MKLRTTILVWVLLLVGIIIAATIGTIAIVFDRSTRARVAEDLERSRSVTLDLHQTRQTLNRQECHVVAEEPRLRAVVATQDIAHETVVDAVGSLAKTLNAGVFVLVDADGHLVADSAAPDATGFDLSDRPVVEHALANGEDSGVWLADGKAFQVAGCRLDFGARIVGALVIGHPIDDDFANTIARQTGGYLVVVADGAPLTHAPPSVAAAEIGPGLALVESGEQEITLGDTHWFAAAAAVPGYTGKQHVRYLLLRSIDEALAPFHRIVRILLVIVAGAAVLTLLLALGLARLLARPIVGLVKRTQAIAGGDLSPQRAAGPTEVVELGVAMDAMAKEIDESRNRYAENVRLAGELSIAARIQTSILPRDVQVAALEISAKMMTATEVGGDYYDILPVADGCWMAVGDASGHGLTAGLVMMMVQTGVATLVRSQPDASPRDVLKTLNRVVFENVHERLEADRHMTLSLMRYWPDGRFVVAGAHMDAIVWRAAENKVELLGTPGTFLAITDDIDHVNVDRSWRMSHGDLMVLVTDGVTEAENAGGKPFGYESTLAVIEARTGEPVSAIRDALFAALTKHSPTLADDATILVLRYVGTHREPA